MRFFSYCAPASQCGGHDYHGNVGAGSSHYYKLEHDTGDDWKFYIDDVEERSETAGFDSGDIVDIGGEVTDPDSDIGVSGLLDVEYETDDDGDWTSFDGTETANDGFWIIEIWGTQDNMQMGTCWHEPGHC